MMGAVLAVTTTIPRPALYHDNLRDHFDASSVTYRQRYYSFEDHFGGPGSPIICIIGGEGAVPPTTGIFYPWVVDGLAKRFKALVIQPEHRFYGESNPTGLAPYNASQLGLLSPQQALADAVHLILSQQRAHRCDARGTAGYCPVITLGGSYPGFLSAMMRLRYPAVVDMSYAASAPLTMYAQQVDSSAYYALITASAERSLPGCTAALRAGFADLWTLSDPKDVTRALGLCEPLPSYISAGGLTTLRDELSMVFQVIFAGLNMGNYPPTNATGLHKACAQMVEQPTVAGLASLLGTSAGLAWRRVRGTTLLPAVVADPPHCYNLSNWLPAGANATISSGDWSGVGG